MFRFSQCSLAVALLVAVTISLPGSPDGAVAGEPRGAALVCPEEDQMFSLTGIAAWDALDVMTGPSERRRVINRLPANADNIRCVGPCRDGWCRVRWHSIVGWIPNRFLKTDGRVRRFRIGDHLPLLFP